LKKLSAGKRRNRRSRLAGEHLQPVARQSRFDEGVLHSSLGTAELHTAGTSLAVRRTSLFTRQRRTSLFTAPSGATGLPRFPPHCKQGSRKVLRSKSFRERGETDLNAGRRKPATFRVRYRVSTSSPLPDGRVSTRNEASRDERRRFEETVA